jgi:hypothetical protein
MVSKEAIFVFSDAQVTGTFDAFEAHIRLAQFTSSSLLSMRRKMRNLVESHVFSRSITQQAFGWRISIFCFYIHPRKSTVFWSQ